MRAEKCAEHLRAAAQIADAHGARIGISAHLAERLHLHRADERDHRVRDVVNRDEADEKQQRKAKADFWGRGGTG